MKERIDLSPFLRYTLRLILPISFLLASGCQMVRSAHSPSGWKKADAEFVLRMDITQQAAEYIGTRYKYTGTSPKTGFDCSGFTSFIMQKFDISLPHQSGSQAKEGRSIPVEKALPGDLVYFNRKGRIFHVALVERNEKGVITVIHSTTSRGVIRENITHSDYWRPKIAGVRSVIPYAGGIAER